MNWITETIQNTDPDTWFLVSVLFVLAIRIIVAVVASAKE